MSTATGSESTSPTNKRSADATGQRAAGGGTSDDVLGAPPAIDDDSAVQSVTGTAPAPGSASEAPAAKRHKASEEEQPDADVVGPTADIVPDGASQPEDGSAVNTVRMPSVAALEHPWKACYTAAGDGSNFVPGQPYYFNLVTNESRWNPPTSSSSSSSTAAAAMSTTAMQTQPVPPVPTVTIATQTIQLLGSAADTALVPAASPSAAAGHATDNTSPPVSPLEPPATAPPPPTPKHAAIAAIKSRLAPHRQKKAALLAQQELIKEQRKELNRQAAQIRTDLEAVKPELLPGEQELREEESYLQLVDQPKAETDAKLRAAQSRMALACGGHGRLGLAALLQNIDISECVAKHVATAVVERRKVEEFGQPAANARKQLQFGMKLEGMPDELYSGIWKVDHERIGAPVLKNEHGMCLFWCAGKKAIGPSWNFTPSQPPAAGADPNETTCRAHTLSYITPQVRAGHLPEGSQTWYCWNTLSKDWEEMQFVTTVFRTEAQAADTEKAYKAAIEAQLSKKAAMATTQLAGIEQIVVSGLPAESQDGNGIYYRKDSMHGFPVFKLQCAVERISFWLLYSTTLQRWVITQMFAAGATPSKQNSTRPNTAKSISSSSDGTLAVGFNMWSCFGVVGDEQEYSWNNKTITVAPQQSS